MIGKEKIMKELKKCEECNLGCLTEPRPPLIEMHGESYNGPMCPKCGSDYPRKYVVFGKRYCIQSDCCLHEKNVPDIPEPPELPKEFNLELNDVAELPTNLGAENPFDEEPSFLKLEHAELLRSLIEEAVAEVAGLTTEQHRNVLGNKDKYINAILEKLTTGPYEWKLVRYRL